MRQSPGLQERRPDGEQLAVIGSQAVEAAAETVEQHVA
jgi:hypothetical protein